ncbi:MAG: acyltransferase [Candidatus Wallbacteria bacterium]|nr:acyltransferase [Candidatus Wallbacteria bacterium]
MARIVRAALVQASTEYTKDKCIKKHVKMIVEAAKKGAKMVCLQEVFNSPYFCAEQDSKWYDWAETIPGPTMEEMQSLAKKLAIVLVVPIYEKVHDGVYYNTAGVIDADGKLLGIYRKNHIPQVKGFWEKFYFKPGNLGYPVFDTAYGRVGVYICYDRHFPDGARILGLHGAEIVFNPSATIEGLSRYLWQLEQPAHAVANGYFVGAINRVGIEKPWKTGKFYGSSYFCDPRGQLIAQGSDSKDEVVVADINFDLIKEVRDLWQFFRDRRPDTYGPLVQQLP